ncbi:SCO family protein [Olivibacter sitiensis]|uniref:SCO family protein n=1 Tax=Olivibacter sitiensis TaxID=376470 RepID=UPI00055EA627|nr:hypothetical protein [Olivibacter sitiensis]
MERRQKFSVKKILILVIILALPGFCYYLLQDKGKNSYKPLPKYGKKELAGTFHTKRGKEIPDTVFHTVDSFRMNSLPDGANYLFSLDSGVCVVGFFSLENRSLADKMNGVIKMLASRFIKNGMVSFVSIDIDSERDRPENLLRYRSGLDYRGEHWVWLYGWNSEAITSLAQNQFLVDVLPNGEDGFIESPNLVLLDSHQRIRGFYDVTSTKEVDRLFDEIKLLLTEEIRNISVNKDE